MCESRVKLMENGSDRIVMEAAALVKPVGDSVVCTDITGEEIRLDGVRIVEINFIRHEMVLERSR
jgi:predicted RNA-binding protein